jgi:RimJ/RimL family protein N-acetyltransferase
VTALWYPDPPLRDDVVALRRWEDRDVRGVVEGMGGTDGDARAWIERQAGRVETGEGLCLAITDVGDDEALGYVGLLFRPQLESGIIGTHAPAEGLPAAEGLIFRRQPGNVGVGYWLLERARHRGLATGAVALLTRWALTEGAVARVEALVETDNIPSQQVVERARFRREGHLRSYLTLNSRSADALIYSLLPEDLRADA